MATRARGLRLPEELEKGIERERKLRRMSFSETAVALLRETLVLPGDGDWHPDAGTGDLGPKKKGGRASQLGYTPS